MAIVTIVAVGFSLGQEQVVSSPEAVALAAGIVLVAVAASVVEAAPSGAVALREIGDESASEVGKILY